MNNKLMWVNEFIQFCINQHDVVCNQKYAKTLPYSFHLNAVAKQAKKYAYLIKNIESTSPYTTEEMVIMGAWAHDLVEDARITYNDVAKLVGKEVADIVYACTECRGKSRAERHSDEFFGTLRESPLGIYVKVCDIIANVSMSMLEDSDMYKKYKSEFTHLKEEVYRKEYKLMFDNLEKLLNVY